MRKLMRREDGDWICHYWRTDSEPLCDGCYQETEQPKQTCATYGAIARIAS